MRRQALILAASLSLLVLLAAASAQAQTVGGPMKASIPFAFNLGRQALPPGDYLMSVIDGRSAQTTLLIETSDGRLTRIVQMIPAGGGKAEEHGKLVFHRYGGQYFLSQVWTGADGVGLELRKARAEREMEVAGNTAERVMIQLARR